MLPDSTAPKEAQREKATLAQEADDKDVSGTSEQGCGKTGVWTRGIRQGRQQTLAFPTNLTGFTFHISNTF